MTTTSASVKISYLPDRPPEDNRVVNHLLLQWAAQEVRIAVNRWVYQEEENDNSEVR